MKSLNRININELLFIDIETAPIRQHFVDLPDHVAKEWIYKMKFRPSASLLDMSDTEVSGNYFAEQWTKQAALFAEFSRVVCIVMGYCYEGSFRVKQYFDTSESKMLDAFINDIHAFNSDVPQLRFCGHYIKGFDLPFLAKRILINRLKIPLLLDVFGLKPWEIIHLDLHEVWKFGIGQSATLPSIAMAFGLPSPKQDIEGSEVAEYFYAGRIQDFQRIVKYCTGDVVTALNVFKSLRSEETYTELQVELIEPDWDLIIPF